MSTINERIREVRDDSGLSRSQFGKNIGVSGDVIKNLDYGLTEPKPLLIDQICKEYHVNRKWLEAGEGEMYTPLTTTEAQLADRFGIVMNPGTPQWKREMLNNIMGKLLEMSDEEMLGVLGFLQGLTGTTPPTAPKDPK